MTCGDQASYGHGTSWIQMIWILKILRKAENPFGGIVDGMHGKETWFMGSLFSMITSFSFLFLKTLPFAMPSLIIMSSSAFPGRRSRRLNVHCTESKIRVPSEFKTDGHWRRSMRVDLQEPCATTHYLCLAYFVTSISHWGTTGSSPFPIL